MIMAERTAQTLTVVCSSSLIPIVIPPGVITTIIFLSLGWCRCFESMQQLSFQGLKASFICMASGASPISMPASV